MSLNIGGAAETIDIGVKNDSGAVCSVGEVMQIKLDGDGFKVGVPAAPVATMRNLTGVIVGRPGATFANGDEMMMRVFGPCKAMIQAGGAVAAGNQISYSAANKYFTIAAAGAPASADAAALIRGSNTQATAGAVAASTLYDVWLSWPNG